MLDIGAKLEEIYQKGWLLVDKKDKADLRIMYIKGISGQVLMDTPIDTLD